MYQIKFAEEVQSYPSRKEAVLAARRLSTENGGTVRVERQNGIERMLYRRGELVEGYVLTPDRRR